MIVVLGLATNLYGAKPSADSKSDPSATVNNAMKESAITTIKLTPEAESRLGIKTIDLEAGKLSRTRTVAGEVVIPPGNRIDVLAPASGIIEIASDETEIVVGKRTTRGEPLLRLSRLPPEKDQISLRQDRIKSRGDLATAEITLAHAKINAARAERLLDDKAGSVRLAENANADVALAEKMVSTARDQVALLEDIELQSTQSGWSPISIAAPLDGVITNVYAAPGQPVVPGTRLLELTNFHELWIKVPVFAGDIDLIDTESSVTARHLYDRDHARERIVHSIDVLPTAQRDTMTIDYFFRLENHDHSFIPAETVNVTFRLKAPAEQLLAPYEAIVYDIHGGTWIYEAAMPQIFIRRRVEIDYVVDRIAALRRGPHPGTKVVVNGAAELFGTEFGVGH